MYRYIFSLLCLFCSLFSESEQTKPSVVIFDFDPFIEWLETDSSIQFIATSLHLDPQIIQRTLQDLHRARMHGISEERFWSEFSQKNRILLPSQWMAQLSTLRRNALNNIPGLCAYIKLLKTQGVKLVLLSNSPQDIALYIRQLDIFKNFDLVFFAYEVKRPIPDIQTFQILLERLHENAKDCIFIDSRQDIVTLAKRLGMQAIRFISTDQLKSELTHKLVTAEPRPEIEESAPPAVPQAS